MFLLLVELFMPSISFLSLVSSHCIDTAFELLLFTPHSSELFYDQFEHMGEISSCSLGKADFYLEFFVQYFPS
jgi:hypothetical protein